MMMPFVAFQLRMQAAAVRQLALIGAIRAAQGEGPSTTAYTDALYHVAGIAIPAPKFALIQSEP